MLNLSNCFHVFVLFSSAHIDVCISTIFLEKKKMFGVDGGLEKRPSLRLPIMPSV